MGGPDMAPHPPLDRALRRRPVICYRSGVVRARAPTRAPGKAVRIRRDPVTVIGDETRESHWPRGREGAGSRTIREPGDLPARALFDSVFAGGPGRGFDDSRSRWRAQRQEPLRRGLPPSAGTRDLRRDGPSPRRRHGPPHRATSRRAAGALAHARGAVRSGAAAARRVHGRRRRDRGLPHRVGRQPPVARRSGRPHPQARRRAGRAARAPPRGGDTRLQRGRAGRPSRHRGRPALPRSAGLRQPAHRRRRRPCRADGGRGSAEREGRPRVITIAGLRDAIAAPAPGAAREARRHLDTLTKPPGSLGRLEELATRLVALTGAPPHVAQPVIFTFAADHGVAAEGVSAYPPSVTAQMVENFLRGGAAVNVLARDGGADLVATGDMGIGNTTAASAITAVVTGAAAEDVTGRGTGVDDEGWRRKVDAVRRALAVNRPDRDDGLDVLAKVGGFEIGGLVGVILGGAARRVPVALDGFIAGAAALVAATIAPACVHALFASHRSAEPGHARALAWLGLPPYLDLGLRLGEGTGAALFVHLARAATRVYAEMATFKSAGVDGPA